MAKIPHHFRPQSLYSSNFMLSVQDLIKAVEKATVTVFNTETGWDDHIIDADILLAELRKMEE